MLFGYDVAWEVVFGDASTNGLMAQRKGVEEVMMGCFLQLQNAWMRFSYPTFVIARWLIPLIPSLRKTFNVFSWYQHYKDLAEETERQRNIASRTTFVQGAQFDEKDGKYQLQGGLKMSQYDIAHDITTFLGAGGEPIGATLVYLIYTVLQDPNLRKELEDESKRLQEPLSDVEVEEKCPLLDGTIYEALRLFGGGLTCLPRWAPTPQELGPYTIPPGTCVSSHSHQLHRNPAVWEDPEK
jgi:cytochrome P450